MASFHVRATEAQALRWNRAAEAEGHASTGTWIAEAVDRHLDALKRSGRPIPLGWRRQARFTVSTPQGGVHQVYGSVSHPFGYYRGTDAGGDRELGHDPLGQPPPSQGALLPSWRQRLPSRGTGPPQRGR